MTPTRPALSLLLVPLVLGACGRTFLDADLPDTGVMPPDAAEVVPPVPAKTTLTPPAGPFNGAVEVTLSTDRPATVVFTTDGSDPQTSPTRESQPAPAKLKFEQTTILSYFSRTPDDAVEAPRSAVYVRAGGTKGSVSGTVRVGDLALGHLCGISADNLTTPLGVLTEKGDVPFLIEGLGTGTHRLVPFSDTNDDGAYLPFVDMSGAAYGFDLDLEDPFKASLEGVKLYLGTSQPGFCTIKGTITFTGPVPNQNLSVAALDPAVMQGGADPQTLLTAFGNGYRVTTNATDTSYPYALYDLAPGQYLPVPALIGGGTGFSINLLADLRGARTCNTSATVTADFEYGQVSLVGDVFYTPAAPAAFAYGAVAARGLSFSSKGASAQIVLMPILLLASGTSLDLTGTLGAKALRDSVAFDLRAFTNLDGAAGAAGAFTSAFAWALNPFAPEPAQASVIATPPEVSVELRAAAPSGP